MCALATRALQIVVVRHAFSASLPLDAKSAGEGPWADLVDGARAVMQR